LLHGLGQLFITTATNGVPPLHMWCLLPLHMAFGS